MMYSMTPQHHTSEQEPSKKLCIRASGAVYASVPSALFGSLLTCAKARAAHLRICGSCVMRWDLCFATTQKHSAGTARIYPHFQCGAMKYSAVRHTCSVLEYSKSEIFSAERGLSEASIRLCSRTCRHSRLDEDVDLQQGCGVMKPGQVAGMGTTIMHNLAAQTCAVSPPGS